MNSVGVMRALAAAVGLSTGIAMANGTEPGPDEPGVGVPNAALAAPSNPLPGASPVPMPVVSMPPVWLQAPAAGAYPYYLVPYPALSRPLPPAYPIQPMQPMMPPGWAPFVMVLVPMRAMPPAPAGVDYGPVAETPVVELPESGMTGASPVTSSVEKPVPLEVLDAGKAPAEISQPDYGPVADTPIVELSMDEPVPEIAGQNALPATAELPPPPVVPMAEAAVITTLSPIDYGPVADTPVVDLLVPEATLPAVLTPAHAKPATVKAKKPTGKKSRTAKAAAKPAASTAPPARKRMCWNNGVVAPCK